MVAASRGSAGRGQHHWAWTGRAIGPWSRSGRPGIVGTRATLRSGGAVSPETTRPDMTALPDLLHGAARAGPVRDRRPVYLDLLPPCNAGCPAGENIQAWLAHARGRPGTSRPGGSWSPTTRCPPSTAGSATTRARPSATGPSWTARSRSTRSSGSSATWRCEHGWAFERADSQPTGQAGAGHRGRAERAVRRLPPGPARPPGGDQGRRPEPGRDDALRHPGLPAAARRAGRRDRPDRGARRADHRRAPGDRPGRRAAPRAVSTRCSSRSARTCPSTWTSRPRTPAGSWTRCRSCARSPRASGR